MKIGGQAVLEGVMIRSQNYYATSIRNENGKIVSMSERIRKKPKWMGIFFIRGVVNLIEMLTIGIKSLNWSASKSSGKKEEELASWQIIMTLSFAVVFALALFVALPYFLSILTGVKEEQSPIIFNIIDGIIKIAVFFLYIYLITFIKDIRRTFEYHGAEHKVVYCYEENLALNVKNAQSFSTKHPRCGTNFLFIVIIISIFLFALIPVIVAYFLPSFSGNSFAVRKLVLFFLRILMIPIIAGISYELLRWSGNHSHSIVSRVISFPGMLFQKLTTREPDKKQIEVALEAVKIVLAKEKKL